MRLDNFKCFKINHVKLLLPIHVYTPIENYYRLKNEKGLKSIIFLNSVLMGTNVWGFK